MLISTFCKVGNLSGVQMLYVTPFLKRMVVFEVVDAFANAEVNAGVSSAPFECGTT